MDRNLWFRAGVIAAVLAVSAYLLWPSYQYFSKYKKMAPDQIAKLSEASASRTSTSSGNR
jgi:cytoskeletal protein RodZ